ncbi:MAG TPA: UPF0182 family protein [Longimicrobiales bacterium]|nr:UPF0182 family protein [Longimicrobiales bacterium]
MAERPGGRGLRTPRRPGRLLAAVVVVLLLILIFGRSAAVFYTDVLWYQALDYSNVYWTRLLAIVSVRAVTGAVGAALILANVWYVLRQLGPVHLRRRYGNLEIAEQVPRAHLVTGAVAISVLAGLWLSSVQFSGNSAVALLAWLRAEPWGVQDPLFGRDLSFYIFSLPVYIRLLDYLLIVIIWSVLLVGIGYALVGAVRVRGSRLEIDDRPRVHFAVLIAGMLLVFGARFLISRYELLLGGGGFGGTIGYTDVHARIPARLVLGLLAFAAAGSLLYGVFRRTWGPPVIAVGVFLLAAVGMGVVYPAIVQKVQVEPNQLASEVEYIRWNMDFTRRAYGLTDLERRSFSYRRADADTWASLAPTLGKLPLWDLQQLQNVFTEIEARRRYYQFPDLDYDRYPTATGPEQVAIGVREFDEVDGLPANSRTWQTLHMNPMATRGFGAVVAPAAEKLRGDPVYWLGDVQPVQRNPAAPAAIELREPSVFFGEAMELYAIVGHEARATGIADEGVASDPVPHVATGVPLSSFVRIAAFSLRFAEPNLLFARELGDTSRLLFRRAVDERVSALAPFLLWDGDAQPVIADGRIVWILDGYTASSNFPLARPDTLASMELRYLRSSVKATVDAVSGEVRMYAIGPIDPILQTYRRIFNGLIRDEAEMPDFVREHLRYPTLLFQVQADVLEEYHIGRAESFFSGQDVWQIPSALSPQSAPGRADFVMAPMPGGEQPEFLLLSAFIARERQNLMGLLIARSDPGHYGELVLLEMPRDDQIKGPSQINAIIEADPIISQQLSLWQQAGRTVHRGRLRMVPTDSSLLYIQPLFLSAMDRGIPQLQRVIVTDGTAVAMAEALPEAIAALLGETGTEDVSVRDTTEADLPVAAGPAQAAWRARALELMREADARLREGDFAGFGAAWSRLRTLLENQPQN